MGQSEEIRLGRLRDLALKCHKADQLDEAMAHYSRYLALAPKDGMMWSNAGALLRKSGRHQLALAAQRRAAGLEPTSDAVRNNLANILADLGQNEEAIELRMALLSRGGGDAMTKALIGKSYRSLGRYDDAVSWLTTCREQHPDHSEIGIQLAMAQLAAQDYANGFKSFRIRWQTDELTPRNLPRPEWQGESLAGKRILVLPEQGFGDAMAFSRFLPALRRFDPEQVLLYCEKPVACLYEGIDGADWTGSRMPDPQEYDVWVNLLDLAIAHFDATEKVPRPAALTVPSDSRDRAAALIAPYRSDVRVGVIWTGSTTYRNNVFRSFLHTEFHRLLGLEGLRLFSLYKGPELAAFQADGSAIPIVDLGSMDRHFGDCAALMLEMDLVITSDTATAHLAGSLGVPVWTLLHWDPFWLWTHTGNRTPWYPSMTLMRQQSPHDWDGVFHRVERRVADLVAAKLAEGRR
ncbi:glycosyltransferase family protein [Ponticoccus sp. SC2-23]|uniref:tetratricopeptide repeat-containing glycosyltransferase family protein n=1 Tax=Alexandriicola marinus TaxID=2081710 RepID=UPI000FD8E278|nr:tetratricopeptide repeat-containing glycosyltransferase family protein [Alexandriicola marinus]MBM1220536.1 glycosyltransferase family protein [Ponticoccus sp. SC6-9]MBM1225222.1 glycosyltransferase family protein [Ponticoccus sp. SC6-15]MBM1228736.1 glycosyltransferase family protein [Ponticoccus sp. SC6-38]MBM1233627.1 glycosyltransferase family protein [Ponticoccus sp. SC6-45]MBM1239237.1 glycosyltransferase family protein [Ponticoccus sp. SC6-49]MBM1243019.1 glycosyltransferase family 